MLTAGTHVFFLWPGSPELSLYVDYFHPVAKRRGKVGNMG